MNKISFIRNTLPPLKRSGRSHVRLQLSHQSVHSGHSRTGHTGHMARLASKLARLANRLPGTNVPGWNFGWPTPKFPDARPTLLIFRLIFPRLIFPRFTLAAGSVDLLSRSSRRPLGYATWVEMLVNSSGLSSSEEHAWNLFARSECDPLQPCFGARRFVYGASLMPWSLARGCSRTGKLRPARCPWKTSLWRSGTGFGR